MLDALDPEKSRRDEIRGQIPFGKKISPVKEVIKKEERRKKKGQTSQKVNRFDPFYFFFYLVGHRGLIFQLTNLPSSIRTCSAGSDGPIGRRSCRIWSQGKCVNIASRSHHKSCRSSERKESSHFTHSSGPGNNSHGVSCRGAAQDTLTE